MTVTSTDGCPASGGTPPPYPMKRECPFDPPAAIGRLRAKEPISRVLTWDGQTPWLVTRHADVRTVLSDQRFSANDHQPGFPMPSISVKERRKSSRSFNSMDNPEHAHLRGMLTAEFTVRRIEALRGLIEESVESVLAQLADGPPTADLVESFSLPLPSLMICHLLGVEYSAHSFFQHHSRNLIDSRVDRQEAAESAAKLLEYLEHLVEVQETDPGDNLIGRLASTRVRTGELSRSDAASMGIILLVGGHETTANMLSLGTVTLLQHPDQGARVRDGDRDVVRAAVEELLRYHSIAHSGLRRVAAEDIELGGVLIRAGEGVIASLDGANRDGALLANPNEFDIDHKSHHVAFGFGIHQCLGQTLARLELQIALPRLLQRFPDLRLAVPAEELPYRDDMLIYGVESLPVRW